MERKFAIITIAFFMSILILPSLIWGGIKIFGSNELVASLEYDLGENRKMTGFSFDNLENYYNDHVPFRSSLIELHTEIDGRFEKFYRTKIQTVLAKTFYPDLKMGSIVSVTDLLAQNESENEADANEDIIQEVIEKADCVYEIVEEKQATCTEDGYVKKVCRDCQDEVEEILKSTGHDEELFMTQEASFLNYGCNIYKCKNCGKKRWTDFQDKLVDDSYLPCVIKNNMTVLGRFNWLFYRGNASLNYYRGVNILSAEEKSSFLNSMQSLQDICDSQNKKLVFAIFPNKEQVYSEYMPSLDIVNEVKREPDLLEYLKTNSDTDVIYPLNELMLGKLYFDTYYPYDSHWNNIGAFIGEQQVLKALGMETIDFWELDMEQTSETERGLIATGALNEEDYTDDFDYVLNYKPEVNLLSSQVTEKYKQIFESDSTNEEKLMIIGDSFRLRTLQYFYKDFSKVTAIHRDDVRDAIEEIKEADVILVCCVERFDADMIKNISTIISILK